MYLDNINKYLSIGSVFNEDEVINEDEDEILDDSSQLEIDDDVLVENST